MRASIANLVTRVNDIELRDPQEEDASDNDDPNAGHDDDAGVFVGQIGGHIFSAGRTTITTTVTTAWEVMFDVMMITTLRSRLRYPLLMVHMMLMLI